MARGAPPEERHFPELRWDRPGLCCIGCFGAEARCSLQSGSPPSSQMDMLAIVVLLLFLVAGPVVVMNRDLLFNRSVLKRASYDPPLPFLIIPSSPGAADIVPAGVLRRRASAQPEAAPPEQWAQSSTAWDESGEPSTDATVIFNRPVDEPVQILPGRLHVLSGENAGEDLRLFSRLGEPPQIVVGRESGPPHRHITLQSPTVSRRHARMDFANGFWTITNLSATNPVLVNDRVLKNGASARKLADGDRIELGEVALRFQAS